MPIYAPRNQSPPFKQALIDLSSFLTPHVFRKNGRRVAKRHDYVDVHRSIAVRQFEYLDAPHRNYVQARTAWFGELAPCQAHLLGAANMEARIALADIAARHLQRYREFYEEPIFLVTVSPQRYVLPIGGASQVDLHGLKQTVRQALAGLSFVGMIDFGLLKSWGREGIPRWNNHVSAHAHCIVVGTTREEIKANLARMGRNFVGVTGRCAAVVNEITARQLEGYFRYSLKAPLFEYQVRTGSRTWHNAETGESEILPRLDAHPLRTGDQLRMAAVVHEMMLDELLFGQGAGTALVREIVDEAREPLRCRNLVAERQGSRPSSMIAQTCSISPRDRTVLSKLVVSPPRRRSTDVRYRWLEHAGEDRPLPSSFFQELNEL